MSKKDYILFNIITGLLKGSAIAAIVLWLLPFWGFTMPVWGIIIVVVAFLIYEIVTFRLGIKTLARKPVCMPEDIVGCHGIATTPIDPDGYVRVKGELWFASSSDTNINEGDDVVVVQLNRLQLRVALAEKK